VSRDGSLVAFLEHPLRNGDTGSVGLVDKSGTKKDLSELFAAGVWGLAWSPDGREVWFTAVKPGGNRALYAVSLPGKSRLLARVPQSLTLQDVARDGRVLVANDIVRVGILAKAPGEEKERELGWRTWSSPGDISDDGESVLFVESGEGSSPIGDLYLRRTDGSAPVRLGEGGGFALSPDGKWALAHTGASEKPQFVLYPIVAGEKRVLPTGELTLEGYAVDFLPDGKSIVFTASEPGHGTRLFRMDVEGGAPRALSPEGYRCLIRGVSPDGRFVVAFGPDQRRYLYPFEGGEPALISGLRPTTDRRPGAPTGVFSTYTS
jgi:Tol biopolymer transport system component